MTASLQSPPVQRPLFSQDFMARVQAMLVSELEAQHAQCAEHQAAAAELRDNTDADSVLERELAEAGALRAREAIEDVESALERLDAGTYGCCELCGAALPIERLEAVPAARTCVACPGRGAGLLR